MLSLVLQTRDNALVNTGNPKAGAIQTKLCWDRKTFHFLNQAILTIKHWLYKNYLIHFWLYWFGSAAAVKLVKQTTAAYEFSVCAFSKLCEATGDFWHAQSRCYASQGARLITSPLCKQDIARYIVIVAYGKEYHGKSYRDELSPSASW